MAAPIGNLNVKCWNRISRGVMSEVKMVVLVGSRWMPIKLMVKGLLLARMVVLVATMPLMILLSSRPSTDGSRSKPHLWPQENYDTCIL